MNRFFAFALAGSLLLFSLSSCVKLVEPETPHDEPDTAKSTFSGLFISPGFYNSVTIRNNDTLANGETIVERRTLIIAR
jgi:hypothetical protein